MRMEYFDIKAFCDTQLLLSLSEIFYLLYLPRVKTLWPLSSNASLRLRQFLLPSLVPMLHHFTPKSKQSSGSLVETTSSGLLLGTRMPPALGLENIRRTPIAVFDMITPTQFKSMGMPDFR
jgi:hypothetical protein